MAQGISQAELAERAGLSEKTISQLESGTRSAPYPRTVRLLSDALHLSSADRASLLAAARSAIHFDMEDASHTSTMIWPRPLTPLFGREYDIAAVCRQLRRSDICLLSIIGPPGVGKTRLALAQQMGNQSGIAMSLGNLGILALQQGNYDQAAALLEESLALARSLGNQTGIATALISLGRIAIKQGDGECAVTRYRESLALCREMGDRASIAECLEGLAAVVGAREDAEQAARLLGAAAALRAAIDAASEVADHSLHERTVATAQAALGHERFETALAGGRALSLSQAISKALSL